MSGIFLNYRTGDGDWAATLLKRELSVRFGVDNVFFAASSIPPGVDFAYQITQRLRECDVLLAIIGSGWLTAVDRRGRRRIDHPDDWVRREIAAAFQHEVRVIPVMLDGAGRLDGSGLPADIAGLSDCQYLRLHHRNDEYDLARLVNELKALVPGLAAAWRAHRYRRIPDLGVTPPGGSRG